MHVSSRLNRISMPAPGAAPLPKKELAMQLNLDHISFTYPSASAPILEDVTVAFPQGWTGIVEIGRAHV